MSLNHRQMTPEKARERQWQIITESGGIRQSASGEADLSKKAEGYEEAGNKAAEALTGRLLANKDPKDYFGDIDYSRVTLYSRQAAEDAFVSYDYAAVTFAAAGRLDDAIRCIGLALSVSMQAGADKERFDRVRIRLETMSELFSMMKDPATEFTGFPVQLSARLGSDSGQPDTEWFRATVRLDSISRVSDLGRLQLSRERRA